MGSSKVGGFSEIMIEQIKTFEKLYMHWLEAKQKPYKENKAEIDDVNNKLTQFLIDFYPEITEYS